MKRSQAFPSQYVAKDDVQPPRRVTIKDVLVETVKGDGGDEDKPVMHFADFEKAMILNNTNWQAIEDVYGDDSDLWRGKQIELYLDPGVMYAGKRVGGVRVRVTSNGAASSGTPQTPSMSHGSGVWTLDQAVAECIKVGITKPDLIAKLKDLGLTSYNPQRDTAGIKQMISEKMAEQQFPTGGAVEFQEADIPF